jgi:type II secretory pathway component GspD/PulD (secretin)
MSLRPSILLAATVLTTAWLPQLSHAQDAANPVVPGPSPQTSPVQPGGQQPPLLSPAPLPLPEEEGPAGAPANPNTPRHYSFEEASISRVFRLLAKQAGIDYIEPPINPSEKISFELSNVTPLQAFEILAQRRGFRVVQNNGIYELVRDDLRNPNRDTVYVTRTYQLRNVDAHLIVEGVANLLGMEVKTPDGITKGFPKPQEISEVSSLSSSSSGGSGGGSDTAGSQSKGKFTSGFPLAAATAEKQGGGGDADQKEYLFTDRNNVLVVRTTEQNQRQVSAYLRRVDRMDDAIVVEVKVLSITANKSKDIGADWALFFGRDSSGNPLFSLNLGGDQNSGNPTTNVGGSAGIGSTGFPQNTSLFGNVASGIVGGFAYSSWGYFLKDIQVAGRIALLKQNNRLYDISQPTVITKSGVPVTISSLTEEPIQNYTPSQTIQTTSNNSSSSSSSLATSVQTFSYGILLDVLATELQNGYVDLTVTPRISTKLGSKSNGQGQDLPIIQANTTTTNVTVPPGRTVAMGGILALNEQRDLRETPGLSKIPLIGKFLFSRDARSLVRTNVIILVTPRIIRAGNSPVATAGCDEQHAIQLNEAFESKIIGGREKSGVLRRHSADPADPCDRYERECEQSAAPVYEGKGIVLPPATPYSK